MDNSEILANDVVNRVCFPGNMEDDCIVSKLSDKMQKKAGGVWIEEI